MPSPASAQVGELVKLSAELIAATIELAAKCEPGSYNGCDTKNLAGKNLSGGQVGGGQGKAIKGIHTPQFHNAHLEGADLSGPGRGDTGPKAGMLNFANLENSGQAVVGNFWRR